MFTKEIYGLTLANAVADAMFPNISGVKYRNDESFTATLRALMHERVPAGGSIKLERTASRYNEREIKNHEAETIIRASLRAGDILDNQRGILRVHSFEGTAEDNTAMFDLLDNDALSKVLSGYVVVPEIAKFLEQKKLRARFYVNTEDYSAIVFIERIEIKKWHLLQSFLPRYFPTLFNDKPLTDDELKLLKSLTNRYAPAYEDCIEEITARFDFRTTQIRNVLTGFETHVERQKLLSVKQEIESVQYRIDDFRVRFQQYYQDLERLRITELGLIEKLNRGNNDNDGDSELVEYFLCNKSLNLVSARNGLIEFIVSTVISNYDPDLFESIIKNRNSFFFQDCYDNYGRKYENKELTDDRIELLMRAIFETQQLKLRVCAVYYLNFETGDYGARRGYEYPTSILKTHTPNQHIQHYACLGNNERIISEAMLNRDYIAAISACCASAGNMNMSESNTGTFFMTEICSNNPGKIIQMPDGTCMTPLDAVKWLEEQNATKEG